MRRKRAGLTGSNKGLTDKLGAVGLTTEGGKITLAKKEEKVAIPLYNPAIHRPGDRVLIKPPYGKKLIETVIPKIDADGNPISDYD